MAERKGLGKGLGALFEDVNIDSTEIEGSEANKEDINFIEIELTQIGRASCRERV